HPSCLAHPPYLTPFPYTPLFRSVPALADISVWVAPAVSSTDRSDSHGIQADGLGEDGLLYRLWSWEQVTSPRDSLTRAILKAVEDRKSTRLNSSHVKSSYAVFCL